MRISDWSSDVRSSDLLLRAWQQWGEACLPRLVGMFAFAVWDARARRVFLVRDQLGIKPLYYGFTSSGDMVFASELKGLRSEEHTSELQSLMRISYAVFCLKKNKRIHTNKLIMTMISNTTKQN